MSLNNYRHSSSLRCTTDSIHIDRYKCPTTTVISLEGAKDTGTSESTVSDGQQADLTSSYTEATLEELPVPGALPPSLLKVTEAIVTEDEASSYHTFCHVCLLEGCAL